MSNPKGFKITSDGTVDGTHIIMPDGKPMGLVQDATIFLIAGEKHVRMHLTQLKPVLDIVIPEEQVTITEIPLKSKKEDPA